MCEFRQVLEVLKWTSHTDLCQQLNQVSSLWQKAALSDEVWDVLCEIYGLDCFQSGQSSKVAFRTQFRTDVVFMLREKWLVGYSVRKKQWEPAVYVNTEIEFDNLSSLVMYLPYIVATGTSNPCTGQSALIHHKTGAITPLPNMQNGRCKHGSLVYLSTVYVFAGSNNSDTHTDTVEKLSLQTPRQWTYFPSLLCKLAFSSPCRKGSCAYIFGGWGTDWCQRLDLDLEVVTLLPFRTPMQGYLTSAFVYDGCICFCQSGNMGRWEGLESAPLVVSHFSENTNSNW